MHVTMCRSYSLDCRVSPSLHHSIYNVFARWKDTKLRRAGAWFMSRPIDSDFCTGLYTSTMNAYRYMNRYGFHGVRGSACALNHLRVLHTTYIYCGSILPDIVVTSTSTVWRCKGKPLVNLDDLQEA